MLSTVSGLFQVASKRLSVRFLTSVGASTVLFTASIAPNVSFGCACGCGVFDVGTGAMFPMGTGGIAYLEADFMDQNKNWSGRSQAPADNNGDKEIKTQFYTAGVEYMFNRTWGVSVDIPFWKRNFTTADEDTGDIGSFQHSALGDIRIRGIYTGFADDMSTGLTVGLKLPTGDSTYANFDPDTEIGTGSTDLLLGGYHLGKLADDGSYNYFVRGQWQKPLHSKAIYHPGQEVIGVAGAYYQGWSAGGDVKVIPLAQLTAAYRGHDGGESGDPANSGYTRVIAAPGVEVDVNRFRAYAEVGFAVYNNMSGNQLVAKQLYKVSFSYSF